MFFVCFSHLNDLFSAGFCFILMMNTITRWRSWRLGQLLSWLKVQNNPSSHQQKRISQFNRKVLQLDQFLVEKNALPGTFKLNGDKTVLLGRENLKPISSSKCTTGAPSSFSGPAIGSEFRQIDVSVRPKGGLASMLMAWRPVSYSHWGDAGIRGMHCSSTETVEEPVTTVRELRHPSAETLAMKVPSDHYGCTLLHETLHLSTSPATDSMLAPS